MSDGLLFRPSWFLDSNINALAFHVAVMWRRPWTAFWRHHSACSFRVSSPTGESQGAPSGGALSPSPAYKFGSRRILPPAGVDFAAVCGGFPPYPSPCPCLRTPSAPFRRAALRARRPASRASRYTVWRRDCDPPRSRGAIVALKTAKLAPPFATADPSELPRLES
jgi:hypothetical protein